MHPRFADLDVCGKAVGPSAPDPKGGYGVTQLRVPVLWLS